MAGGQGVSVDAGVGLHVFGGEWTGEAVPQGVGLLVLPEKTGVTEQSPGRWTRVHGCCYVLPLPGGAPAGEACLLHGCAPWTPPAAIKTLNPH